jgi:iron-sulfur cluster repair protein YtfE (RIC family)
VTTIYQKIIVDHIKARAIYAEIGSIENMNKNKLKELFLELVKEITVHIHAEEDIFYDYLKKNPKTKDLIAHGHAEHEELEILLKKMENLHPGEPAWYAKLKEVMDKTFHHMEEEETKIFAQAKTVLSAEVEEVLGKAFDEKKLAYQESYVN